VAAILADFQAWLRDLPAAAEGPPPEVGPGPDLFTLLEQLTALRQEVNLHTRAARAQQEQNAATLGQLTRALDAVQQVQITAPAPVSPNAAKDDPTRPLLQTLVELFDALAVAGREAQRVQDLLTPTLNEANQPAEDDFPELPDVPAPSRLARWLGARAPDLSAYRDEVAAWHKREADNAARGRKRSERIKQLLTSLTAGYTMSLQRIDRALKQHGLQAVPAVGQPFDPERMEAVEAVAGSGQTPGLVLDEVQRGYLWKGRIFRYARVRVAK
jgi:molecular chaperone GrpE